MSARAKVQGTLRFEPVGPGEYSILERGRFVGTVKRDKYRNWDVHRADGIRVGCGPKMIEASIRTLKFIGAIQDARR